MDRPITAELYCCSNIAADFASMVLTSVVACNRYGDGTLRLTVEQDVLFPNVPEANLEAMQKELLFQR